MNLFKKKNKDEEVTDTHAKLDTAIEENERLKAELDKLRKEAEGKENK